MDDKAQEDVRDVRNRSSAVIGLDARAGDDGKYTDGFEVYSGKFYKTDLGAVRPRLSPAQLIIALYDNGYGDELDEFQIANIKEKGKAHFAYSPSGAAPSAKSVDGLLARG
jgi:hypothetical protein